jgi:hypothetical protein
VHSAGQDDTHQSAGLGAFAFAVVGSLHGSPFAHSPFWHPPWLLVPLLTYGIRRNVDLSNRESKERTNGWALKFPLNFRRFLKETPKKYGCLSTLLTQKEDQQRKINTASQNPLLLTQIPQLSHPFFMTSCP